MFPEAVKVQTQNRRSEYGYNEETCCYDRKLLTYLSRCGWESLKAYFTSCSRQTQAVPGPQKLEKNNYIATLASWRPNTTKRITSGGEPNPCNSLGF
jgi:hypothetical protein